jgi:hypothetical protein
MLGHRLSSSSFRLKPLHLTLQHNRQAMLR